MAGPGGGEALRYEVRDLVDSGCRRRAATSPFASKPSNTSPIRARPPRAAPRHTARGLLLVSSPNLGGYPSDNTHHVRELEPERLDALLRSRFRNVRLFPQHTCTASLADSRGHAAADGAVVLDARLSKLAAGEPGRSLYTVAAASDGRLLALGALAMLARAEREASRVRGELERQGDGARVQLGRGAWLASGGRTDGRGAGTSRRAGLAGSMQ